MKRRFVTLDVFTAKRFAGNPLAVVLDAGELDDGTMQAVAREFNHPETVFVLAPATDLDRLVVGEARPCVGLSSARGQSAGDRVTCRAPRRRPRSH